jgi:hypothetical protein
MAVTLLFVFLTVSGWAAGHSFNIQNNFPDPIYFGFQAYGTAEQLFNGGFALGSGAIVSMELES